MNLPLNWPFFFEVIAFYDYLLRPVIQARLWACGRGDMSTLIVLAATLTLSQPRGADYAHPILVSTPSFESHRRA